MASTGVYSRGGVGTLGVAGLTDSGVCATGVGSLTGVGAFGEGSLTSVGVLGVGSRAGALGLGVCVFCTTSLAGVTFLEEETFFYLIGEGVKGVITRADPCTLGVVSLS